MAESKDLLHELRHEIEQGRMLVVVGAGVSIAATGDECLASWTGLLRDGAERCVEVAGPLPDGWADRVLAEIDSGDLDELLSAAEKISRKLGAPCAPSTPAGCMRRSAASRSGTRRSSRRWPASASPWQRPTTMASWKRSPAAIP